MHTPLAVVNTDTQTPPTACRASSGQEWATSGIAYYKKAKILYHPRNREAIPYTPHSPAYTPGGRRHLPPLEFRSM